MIVKLSAEECQKYNELKKKHDAICNSLDLAELQNDCTNVVFLKAKYVLICSEIEPLLKKAGIL